MATLVGAVAAILAGLGLAAGGSFALVSTSDPDTTTTVEARFQDKYNPLDNLPTIYGNR